MRPRRFFISLIVALILAAASTPRAEAWQKKSIRPKADTVSGDWNASLTSEASQTGFALTLKLKLEGTKVTGSYESDHVGSGKISKGSWAANKLNITLETNHGLITLTGELKQGKLAGKFDAGPMHGTWQASRK